MNLVVIHKNTNLEKNEKGDLIKFALCESTFSKFFIYNLKDYCRFAGEDIFVVLPEQWKGEINDYEHDFFYYEDNLNLDSFFSKKSDDGDQWFVVQNGNFAVRFEKTRLKKVLSAIQAEIIAINVTANVQAMREKVVVSDGNLFGFRRYYDDFCLPVPLPDDWPHYVFIRGDVLKSRRLGDFLPVTWDKFIEVCNSSYLNICSLDIGGVSLNLDNENDLLGFVEASFDLPEQFDTNINAGRTTSAVENDITIAPDAKIVGQVLLGRNVTIGKDVIILGPAVIGDNVNIASDSIVKSSIIGSGITLPQGAVVENRILKDIEDYKQNHIDAKTPYTKFSDFDGDLKNSSVNSFRIWPRFSYARFIKRIVDIVASFFVLILFAPVFPIIALAVKLSSSGPVFFKDYRQGLHGKEFACLKFRTMITGAESIQSKLRYISQVDGPQFKIEKDPRITLVGDFLRNTFIDEIPQFINILLGHMSLVGPRPSPKSENILCPVWRDARLSTRPGITGLWQVCRTRKAGRDFQEWIYYDIQYVRNLSFAWDISICLKTVKKIIKSFIEQF